jgi:monofunctional biosynthetic peptidoglycan transglycosylase
MRTSAWLRHLFRIALLSAIALLSLQLYFLARIALMNVMAPQSTTFQRSEAWRLLTEHGRIEWSQQWVADARIAANLKRAVIASEDAAFTEHSGFDWDAIERAWDRNQRAEARAQQRNSNAAGSNRQRRVEPKVIGGSTISQQLAKNMFLSGERTPLRKAEEFALTFALEACLSKRRILEIYLNNVEWGEGLFGAQAAARHYYRVDASQLGPYPAARLAVMLPAPKRFEKLPSSPYVAAHAAIVLARMSAVDLP